MDVETSISAVTITQWRRSRQMSLFDSIRVSKSSLSRYQTKTIKVARDCNK
jgi:hypothetical protein